MKAQILTQYSAHANTIADTFRAAFSKFRMGTYSVEMTAPEGSTGGGLLALQHVTLKPDTGMALVVGTVNAGEKLAELRSYAHVATVHEERFKRALPFDEASYGAFLEKAESLFGAFGIKIKVTDTPSDMPPPLERAGATEETPSPALTPAPSRVALVAGVLVLGIMLGAAAVWLALR